MPPKNDVALADVALVGARRRVDRHQDDVVTAGEQLGRQRVVAQAAAAIHRPRSARKRQDPHVRPVYRRVPGHGRRGAAVTPSVTQTQPIAKM